MNPQQIGFQDTEEHKQMLFKAMKCKEWIIIKKDEIPPLEFKVQGVFWNVARRRILKRKTFSAKA